MREIKFRAWDKTNNKMTVALNKETINISVFSGYRISDYVAMQYTGLKIKDKEIYEGDIIKARNDYSYKVVFENGSFVLYHLNKYADVDMVRWGLLGRLFDSDMRDILDKCEIIGNIYENPELLEQTK